MAWKIKENESKSRAVVSEPALVSELIINYDLVRYWLILAASTVSIHVLKQSAKQTKLKRKEKDMYIEMLFKA